VFSFISSRRRRCSWKRYGSAKVFHQSSVVDDWTTACASFPHHYTIQACMLLAARSAQDSEMLRAAFYDRSFFRQRPCIFNCSTSEACHQWQKIASPPLYQNNPLKFYLAFGCFIAKFLNFHLGPRTKVPLQFCVKWGQVFTRETATAFSAS